LETADHVTVEVELELVVKALVVDLFDLGGGVERVVALSCVIFRWPMLSFGYLI